MYQLDKVFQGASWEPVAFHEPVRADHLGKVFQGSSWEAAASHDPVREDLPGVAKPGEEIQPVRGTHEQSALGKLIEKLLIETE